MKLYPLLPLIFIAAYLFVAISIYNDDPEAATNGLLIFLAFILIYFVNKLLNNRKNAKSHNNLNANKRAAP
jgi:APA family basic amino acid/polyamine antiporter